MPFPNVFKPFIKKVRTAIKNRNKIVEISYSRLQTYNRCPWLYYLVYEKGWRAGPNASMALGQSLHKTLEAYLSQKNSDRSLEGLFGIYDQLWVNEGFASPEETLNQYDLGRKMLERFYNVDQKRTGEILFTEKNFDMRIKKTRFRGTIDRLDKSSDGAYEIIEYKTQGEHWSPARIQNDLQLTLYQLGVERGLKLSPVRLKYYFLSSGEFTETTRTQTQLKEAEQLLLDTASRLRREIFSPNHAHCGRCEFANRCEFYKQPSKKN